MAATLCSFPVVSGKLWSAPANSLSASELKPLNWSEPRNGPLMFLHVRCVSLSDGLAEGALCHLFPLFPPPLNGSGCILLIKTSRTLLLNPFQTAAGVIGTGRINAEEYGSKSDGSSFE